jgi:hypothetical protein
MVISGRTPEDLVMQLLVLKMLYILFNTKGLSEYFYTNDLCVLVDVFLREIVDLDEEAESVCCLLDFMPNSDLTYLQLRHTYLRVLHPLLTKTQLRSFPYKRPQIVRALESLTAHQEIREISSTTKRLVERCLSGEWCVQHRALSSVGRVAAESELLRTASPGSDGVAAQFLRPKPPGGPVPPTTDSSLWRRHSLKGSRSADNLREMITANAKPASRVLESLCKPGNDSPHTLPITSQSNAAATHRHAYQYRDRMGSETLADKWPADLRSCLHLASPREVKSPIRHNSLGTEPMSPVSGGDAANALSVSSPPSHTLGRSPGPRVPPRPASTATSCVSTVGGKTKVQRRSPPAPPKRRKPPAVPVRVVGTSNSGAEIAAIASSKH